MIGTEINYPLQITKNKINTMKKLNFILLSIFLLGACQNSKKTVKEETKEVQEETKTAFDESFYKKKGKEIAQATFKAFVGHIQAKSKEGGLPAVLNFCHDNALKLTDSMAEAYNVKIKRTSHKLRNPYNAPDEMEKEILNKYLSAQKNSEKLQPIIKEDTEGNVHFYAPILIKHDCLKCHGEPGKEIPKDIYQMIKEKYPQDQAINFKEGDLRGIWDIEFPKENK